jgi:hypothetical protein
MTSVGGASNARDDEFLFASHTTKRTCQGPKRRLAPDRRVVWLAELVQIAARLLDTCQYPAEYSVFRTMGLNFQLVCVRCSAC